MLFDDEPNIVADLTLCFAGKAKEDDGNSELCVCSFATLWLFP